MVVGLESDSDLIWSDMKLNDSEESGSRNWYQSRLEIGKSSQVNTADT